jgi:hypothetical protein
MTDSFEVEKREICRNGKVVWGDRIKMNRQLQRLINSINKLGKVRIA